MEVRVAENDWQRLQAPLLVLIETGGNSLFAAQAEPVAGALARLRRVINKNSADTGVAEALLPLPDSSRIQHVVLINAESPAYLPPAERLKTAASRGVVVARRLGLKRLAIALDGPAGPAAVPEMTEGCMLGAYEFTKYKSGPARKVVATTLLLERAAVRTARNAVGRMTTICRAVNFARDLINEPPAVLGPASFAAAAAAEARRAGLGCDVLDERQLRRLGCGGILAVGRGAREAPRMAVLRHRPKTSARAHVALVGKGVTFDTGGHCLKPADGMWRMKSDMAGGAAVIGALIAAARLRLPLSITGIVPIVENAIGPAAMLPGEIIRMANGKTVHVDNTDAEGRLILADALWYAKREGATHAVDIATLTGAAARALGKSLSALFCDDEDWAGQLLAAGAASGDMLWRLPLHAEYSEMLKHDCADMDNSGKSPNAGAIVAALFLKEFVDPSLVWAHLDIAGTAMAEKQWKYFAPGATGVGVRLFLALLSELAGQSKR